jgi:hypothetical protein
MVFALWGLVWAVGYPLVGNLEDTQDWQARKILELDKAQGEHRRAIADIERKMQTLDRYVGPA